MILLSEIFEILQGAEFNSLSIVDNEGGEAVVDRKEYNRLAALVNAGLTALHKRFDLKRNTLRIKTTEGVVKYVLDSKNALSNSPYGFIIDSGEDPFTDDIIEIIQLNAPNGRDLVLNNYGETIRRNEIQTVPIDELCQSIYTFDYRTLRVPVNLRDSEILVTYKSTGKKIPQIMDNNTGELIIDPKDVIIELPVSYLNAITYYVASRVYNSKGAETIGRGIFHEGNNYKSLYENEINSLAVAGLEVDMMIDDNSGFYNRGFV